MESLGVAAVASGVRAVADDAGRPHGKKGGQCPLALSEFQPKSMLHVSQTRVERTRFPVIDFHTHLSMIKGDDHGVSVGEEMTYLAPPAELLSVMDRRNLRTLVNLTGGWGRGIEQTVEKYQKAEPGRFIVFTTPAWERCNQPGYAQFQTEQIEHAHRAGAYGLKVEKILGLYLRENIGIGPLMKVDDLRFDPMWEACGALHMPVAIHVSDPEAFFLPIDRFNERFEEPNNHPDCSFHGKDFPSNSELLEARNRVFARHPRTQFVALHAGNYAENLSQVSECLDRFPNMYVDIAARIGELGASPGRHASFSINIRIELYSARMRCRTRRLLFSKYSATSSTKLLSIFGNRRRVLRLRCGTHSAAGRWCIYGLGLPEDILRKIYYENAARLLGIELKV